MKIYTRTGDDGTTGLFGGRRVRKDDARIEACGSVDELNAALGVMIASLPIPAQKARGWLDALQSDLFVAGALLATPSDAHAPIGLSNDRIEALENHIDEMEKDLPPLKNFILPQGTPCAAAAHLARAISRRAERRIVELSAHDIVDPLVVILLNRISDFLFVLARWINAREGGLETAWIHQSQANPTQNGPVPDRLNVSLNKLEEERQKRQTQFERAAMELEKKKREASHLFQKSVEQINKDGGKVEKPFREIDLD